VPLDRSTSFPDAPPTTVTAYDPLRAAGIGGLEVKWMNWVFRAAGAAALASLPLASADWEVVD
jgi:hypothetical protein